MVKTITPFSTRAKEGATDSPLGDFVNVDQSIVSTADVGFYDQSTGKLTGVQASDKIFGNIQTDAAIANGGTFNTPSANADGTWPLSMTGFRDLFIAIKPSNGGAYQINAVMGPDGAGGFGGLTPVNPAALLRGNYGRREGGQVMQDLFKDSGETLIVDVWNIFSINESLANQKLLMFSLVNNSGGTSTIDTAFLRIV